MSEQDEKLREEEAISRHPDPVAKARAAKAAKAAAKAAADAAEAEKSANASRVANDGNPRVSSRASAQFVQPDEGPLVEVRVTYKGHGQISTGEDFGFERYGRNARFSLPEMAARSLYEKGWAEPQDERYVDKWEQMARRERAINAKAKREFEDVLQNGVSSGHDYNSHASFGGLAPL